MTTDLLLRAEPWAAIAWLAAFLLLAYPWAALRIDRSRRAAPRLADGAPDEDPRVTVLLPLRDEEDNAGPCIRSLLDQTARPRVVAVDDGSTDGTGEVLATLRKETDRLTVVSAGDLPDGWRGKVHALERGRRRVEEDGGAEWLLLTDADTRHHPRLLARALAAAQAHGLSLLSVAGRQVAAGAGENLVVPGVFALLDAPIRNWEEALGGRVVVANGQFILVRRETLERLGGFAAVRFEALDDLALARAVRAQGEDTGFVRAPDLLEVRMYRGFRRTVAGWRRNLGALFAATPGRALALVAALSAPPAAVALGAVAAPGAALLAWAAAVAASALVRRGGGGPVGWALLAPLDFLAVAFCLAAGVADVRRGRLASWKGRPMPLAP